MRKAFRISLLNLIRFLICLSILIVSSSLFWLDINQLVIQVEPHVTSSNLIHDPYTLKKNPPLPFNYSVCDKEPGTGEEGPAGIQALFKIKKASKTPDDKPEIRLLCLVYSHSNRHHVVRSIAETYGRHCDGFWAASNQTDPTIGASMLSHTGPETYDNLYIKIRAMWFYVDQHYLSDFDWFHIGGDDMFVIPENIKRLAAKYPPKQPVILGASIPNYKKPKRRFCGGGAGYTLNAQAVRLLVQRFVSECPKTVSSQKVHYLTQVKKMFLLGDVWRIPGVKCQDTNDELHEARYHHLDAHFHTAWTTARKVPWNWEKLQFFHNIIGNKTKLGQISSTSTTFHLDKSQVRSLSADRGMSRYHAILVCTVLQSYCTVMSDQILFSYPSSKFHSKWDLCGNDFSMKVERAANLNPEERKILRKKWELVPKVSRAKS